jgi:hypothetical protein
MKIVQLLFCFLVFSNFLLSQKVDIIKQADPSLSFRHKNKAFKNITLGFMMLEDSINISNQKFVATFKISLHNPPDLGQFHWVYQIVQKRANNLGANAYRLREFAIPDSSKYSYCIIDTYFITDSIFVLNRSAKPVDIIFAFPNDQYPGQVKTFKFNDKKFN